MAQLGVPDMKTAIALALSYPERLPLQQPLPDFSALGQFTFAEPDLKKFPCLALAMEACKSGGTFSAVMNAANEIAVAAFLEDRLFFDKIPVVIQRTLEDTGKTGEPSLADILEADKMARLHAVEIIGAIYR